MAMFFKPGTFSLQNAGKAWSYSETDEGSSQTLRFEVRPDDHWRAADGTKERSEVSSGEKLQFGKTYTLSYDFMVEPGARSTEDNVKIGQLHGTPDAGDSSNLGPVFAIQLDGEKMKVVTRADADATTSDRVDDHFVYADKADIQRGHWYDMQIVFKLDPFGHGLLEVWRDGVELVHYTGALGYNDAVGPYWKEGIYRAAGDVTMAVDFKDTTLTEGDATTAPPAAPVPTPPAAPPPAPIPTPLPAPAPVPPSDPHDPTSPPTSSGDGDHDAAGLTLSGGGKADILIGAALNDVIHGGLGNDQISGFAGADALFGDDGKDRLDGGDGSDTLSGGTGDDVLQGGAGVDNLDGGTGNDTLLGGDGADVLQGGASNDSLDGGTGNDELHGGEGRDILVGGDGADSLHGDAAADTLTGGAGDDQLEGGLGSDVFVFSPHFGNDVISDFGTRGVHDAIEFHSLFANFDAMLAHTTQVGADVVIRYDADDSLTLKGVALKTLDVHDFHFLV